MNNEQIIKNAAIEMLGEETVGRILSSQGEIPVHTLKGWNLRGFNVKKGEHGYEIRLWKKKHKKEPEDDTLQLPNNTDFCLCKAYLFTQDQVEEIEDDIA